MGEAAARRGGAIAPSSVFPLRELYASIKGNFNPWVIGISNYLSEEGQAGPVDHPLGGAIDSLRISSVRRSYAQ